MLVLIIYINIILIFINITMDTLNKFLETYNYFIDCKPSGFINCYELSDDIMEQIIFNDGKYKFAFPLNNDLLFYEKRVIKGPITIRRMLQIVYNFYQEPLNVNDIEKAFEGCEYLKEEYEYIKTVLLEENYTILKYNVFTTDPDPDFCGLHFNSETGEYEIELGPI